MDKDKNNSEIEKKVLWLSCWMIHNANHIRDNEDDIKVGGHQASCASMVSMMVALYFNFLNPKIGLLLNLMQVQFFMPFNICLVCKREKR